MTIIRLNNFEIESIKQSFQAYFLPDDQLWIFGSRVNPHATGGDIDLYVNTHYTDAQKIVEAKILFLTALQLKIGEQKIDLVVQFNNHELPIYTIAQTQGIQLL